MLKLIPDKGNSLGGRSNVKGGGQPKCDRPSFCIINRLTNRGGGFLEFNTVSGVINETKECEHIETLVLITLPSYMSYYCIIVFSCINSVLREYGCEYNTCDAETQSEIKNIW